MTARTTAARLTQAALLAGLAATVGGQTHTPPHAASCEQQRRFLEVEAVGAMMPHLPRSGSGGQDQRLLSGLYAPFSFTGNPVLHSPTVYLIWYGNWAAHSPKTEGIITSAMPFISGHPWTNIISTYMDHQGACSNAMPFGSSISDAYSQGASLTMTTAANAVYRAQQLQQVPYSQNAIYLVLPSPDVTVSGMCTSFCGYHSYFTLGSNARYVFGLIGATSQCPAECSGGATPSGDTNADGMISCIAHELVEATTDPYFNAYIDSAGTECADRCAWGYSNTYRASNGQLANVHWGGFDFLVQDNWLNAGTSSACVNQYGPPSPSQTPPAAPSLTPTGTATRSPTRTVSISRSGTATNTQARSSTRSASATRSVSLTGIPVGRGSSAGISPSASSKKIRGA